jgi:hypothetical protein
MTVDIEERVLRKTLIRLAFLSLCITDRELPILASKGVGGRAKSYDSKNSGSYYFFNVLGLVYSNQEAR